MTKLLGLLLFFGLSIQAAVVPSFDFKNQYGEQSNNYLVGGSGMIEVKFAVDASNVNGLGIRGLTTSSGADIISAVYMNTSATPAVGNPNPSPGYVFIKFKKGYSGFLSSSQTIGSPPSASLVNVTAGLSQGKPYTIYATGTTTAAQWQFLGLPSNVTPTPSQSFIAVTGAAGTGTGQVALATAVGSAIGHFEVVGSPSLDMNSLTGGGTIILQALAPTNSSTTTLTPTAPTNNTSIYLNIVATPQPGPQI